MIKLNRPEKDVLTCYEAAQLLRVSTSYLRQKAKRGEIPCLKVGKVFRFSKSALLALLKSR